MVYCLSWVSRLQHKIQQLLEMELKCEGRASLSVLASSCVIDLSLLSPVYGGSSFLTVLRIIVR